ncbi:MAG TPA: YkgJ family cysteine cluster protein, partial [Planctomycetota bacterium]|nr:YkgJ family cysteine cluster protein [Planctomycetota bacterium]
VNGDPFCCRMTPLSSSDRLPLTCTRLNTCCHEHRILVSPWELAWLAQGMGMSPRALRDTRMDNGGTRLRADGPVGVHGPAAHRVPACTVYDDASGCRAHSHRPLACRLYPLGRQRHEGAIRYYHPGAVMPCRELCPTVSDLPERTVGDYLAEQDIAAGEAAHDGYAALAYGLVNAALVIADAGAVTRASLAQHFAILRTWSGGERAAGLGVGWYDALTIPELPITANAASFVAAHGQSLVERIQREFLLRSKGNALADATRLELLLALHLGSTVGADAAVMAILIQPTVAP